ncbi:MAG TPA: helical backbone metal receptor [Flavisolibacter sp.]|nr:helical backbone metal receptor [Flavisolibacter sp.]
MSFFTDQLGRTIELGHPPKRIISLVPSQTELLADLDLEQEVIGITKFCVHPGDWYRTKRRIGGTKQLDLALIRSLQPDLIIANKEENVKEQVEALAADFPVWVSDVNNLDDAIRMIDELGIVTGRQKEAKEISSRISEGFDSLESAASPLRTAYLIWRDPYMTVGGDTFINHLLSRCGLQNIFAGELRYPAVTVEELHARTCELLLLSSEPYPFKQKHIDELKAFLPNATILLVDGELFSWYGSRLLHSPLYFQQLLEQIPSIS